MSDAIPSMPCVDAQPTASHEWDGGGRQAWRRGAPRCVLLTSTSGDCNTCQALRPVKRCNAQERLLGSSLTAWHGMDAAARRCGRMVPPDPPKHRPTQS